jgi:hypothetical protein
MWPQVEMMARVMLDKLIDQVSGTGGIDLTKDIKNTKDNLLAKFDEYTQKVKARFFLTLIGRFYIVHDIWNRTGGNRLLTTMSQQSFGALQ